MLAGRAIIHVCPSMDRSDVPNALRKIGRSSESVQYDESESIYRLQDLKFQWVFTKRETTNILPHRKKWN
jgi:hypothetical protein